MNKVLTSISVVGAALALTASLAGATVTFDSVAGTGFVGKGDVKLALGLNNAQVQNTTVAFEYVGTREAVTEVSWQCTNSNNETIQERARTTTTTSSVAGIVSSLARVKNQITGYNLSGYSGEPDVSSTSETDGPPVDSCPAGPWSLTSAAGEPETISSTSTGGLYVNDVLLP